MASTTPFELRLISADRISEARTPVTTISLASTALSGATAGEEAAASCATATHGATNPVNNAIADVDRASVDTRPEPFMILSPVLLRFIQQPSRSFAPSDGRIATTTDIDVNYSW
ncbi:hypothetical protein [Novosphingobium sp. PhB165]|uniref:hypothetical protein n=1 Tax=Novosphingobium sp. PhB165 TaxID=2485105 RepID=UPI001FB1A55D|nr:hypothetical protein [Novosphingobium sp. PhB165]